MYGTSVEVRRSEDNLGPPPRGRAVSFCCLLLPTAGCLSPGPKSAGIKDSFCLTRGLNSDRHVRAASAVFTEPSCQPGLTFFFFSFKAFAFSSLLLCALAWALGGVVLIL